MFLIRGALESVVAGRVWRGHHIRPLALALGECVSAIVGSLAVSTTLFVPRTCLPAELPMSPPRDTAGATGTQPQPAERPGRYNQKSTTFRNGTTEEGWFYPTPAALKAAADVRGARSARESCRLRRLD